METGPRDAGLQVVRHHLRRDAAEEGKGALVAGDPVWQALGPGRLGICLVRCPQGRDEQLRRAHFAGLGVDHIDRQPRVIDKQPFPVGWR